MWTQRLVDVLVKRLAVAVTARAGLLLAGAIGRSASRQGRCELRLRGVDVVGRNVDGSGRSRG